MQTVLGVFFGPAGPWKYQLLKLSWEEASDNSEQSRAILDFLEFRATGIQSLQEGEKQGLPSSSKGPVMPPATHHAFTSTFSCCLPTGIIIQIKPF